MIKNKTLYLAQLIQENFDTKGYYVVTIYNSISSIN